MSEKNIDYNEPSKDRRKANVGEILKQEFTIANKEIKKLRHAKMWQMGLKTAGILVVVGIVAIGPMLDKKKGHIAVMNVDGAIMAGSTTGDGKKLSETFNKALKNDAAKAILINANSPGGSPVHSEMFYETLMDYRREREAASSEERETMKPVYVSIGDMCASACVYIVSAADKIYAHNSSIVGSIGVKMESWGYTGIMEKLGVERRVLSKGEHKTVFSPYFAQDDVAVEFIDESILTPSYELFKRSVVEGRRKPEMAENPTLFSGLIWGGERAQEIGLVDEIRTTYHVVESLKEEYNVEKTYDYNPVLSQGFLASLMKGATEIFVDTAIERLQMDQNNKLTF